MADRAMTISTLQPKQQNIWDLYIPGVEGFDGLQDTLVLSLRNMPLPKEDTSIVTIPMDGTEVKFAGKTTYQNLSVTLNDFIDRDSANLVRLWRRSVFNPETGATGLVANYKKNGFAKVYTSEEEYICTYDTIGVWPATADYGALDKGSAETVQISVTISIDRAFLRGPVVTS